MKPLFINDDFIDIDEIFQFFYTFSAFFIHRIIAIDDYAICTSNIFFHVLQLFQQKVEILMQIDGKDTIVIFKTAHFRRLFTPHFLSVIGNLYTTNDDGYKNDDDYEISPFLLH